MFILVIPLPLAIRLLALLRRGPRVVDTVGVEIREAA